MTRHDIMERLYNSADLDECIRKTVRPDHQKDFKHELFLLLYELPSERITGLDSRNELLPYVVTMLCNLARNKNKSYQKKYNVDNKVLYVTEFEKADDDDDLSIREQKEIREQQLVEHIRTGLDDPDKFPYYREIVGAVDKYGGIRAASRATGIPKSSLADTIKKVRDKLNSIYNGEPDAGIY